MMTTFSLFEEKKTIRMETNNSSCPKEPFRFSANDDIAMFFMLAAVMMVSLQTFLEQRKRGSETHSPNSTT